MRAELPPKYYLSHARELFSFVAKECFHLLSQEHLDYLAGAANLNEDAECLLIRCLTRKPKFIKTATLDYAEINQLGEAIKELSELGYLNYAQASDWSQLAPQLTKPQLIKCLAQTSSSVKTSASKATLLNQAMEHLNGHETHLASIYQNYLVRRQSDVFEYISFLFFGDIRNRFQQFAMRDLGVLKTRKSAKTIARFDTLAEAQSAFKLQQTRRDFMLEPNQLKEDVADYLTTAPAIGHSARETYEKLLLSVGNALLDSDPIRAIELWRRSDEPAAVEKWVRETYKHGDKKKLAIELETMRKLDASSATQVFIEDFYARKYLGKRTSIFTDMLREPAQTLAIDEAYINDVEDGVIAHYQRIGIEAVFTENKLWRILFALTFWDLLYGTKQTQFSEFDRLPSQLRSNTFYASNNIEIEQKLQSLDQVNQTLQRFTKLVVEHYGKTTGIFRWSRNILSKVETVLRYSPPSAIANVLRAIAKNYKHTVDGYPDLMVIKNGKLRFEEIKAPGDVLRPNQLVSIRRLRNAGYQVELSQVEWTTNPTQNYAVVDIETTGGRKGGNAITEIAVVKVQNQKIIAKWSSLVNPQRHIPAHITRLTGIDNLMVARAPLFSEIAQELNNQLEGCIFVAHNVGFDYGFIKAGFEAIGQTFKKPKYCTVASSRKTFPGLKSYSLGALTEQFDIDLDGHHRALNDATATAHLLCLIQEQKLARTKLDSTL